MVTLQDGRVVVPFCVQMLRLTVWMVLIAQWGWSQVAFTDPTIVSWG